MTEIMSDLSDHNENGESELVEQLTSHEQDDNIPSTENFYDAPSSYTAFEQTTLPDTTDQHKTLRTHIKGRKRIAPLLPSQAAKRRRTKAQDKEEKERKKIQKLEIVRQGDAKFENYGNNNIYKAMGETHCRDNDTEIEGEPEISEGRYDFILRQFVKAAPEELSAKAEMDLKHIVAAWSHWTQDPKPYWSNAGKKGWKLLNMKTLLHTYQMLGVFLQC